MLIYNTTKVRVGISISLMPLPCVKNLPSARLIFFFSPLPIFFPWNRMLLQICPSQHIRVAFQRTPPASSTTTTQQQCGSMSKNHFAQFPDDRVHQKCKGKKLIMPDMLRIRCRTGIHIGTKAFLKSYLTYHFI